MLNEDFSINNITDELKRKKKQLNLEATTI